MHIFLKKIICATAVASITGIAMAKDITISVWAGGSNEFDQYRLDAIEMAADILQREAAIEGETLNITVEKKRDFGGWSEFKQAVTLAAESGKAPSIIVTGHTDIAPWSKAGYIVPAEDYLDFDAWPLNNLYENLAEIASYDGVQWGVPQDAESRPFFFWKEHMRKIGYSDAQIDALPAKIKSGQYTLANVLADAKKAVDMGVVEKGYGFYPRPVNGPDWGQFYQSFGGVLQDADSGKLILNKSAMQKFYQFFADAVAAGVTKKNHIGTDWNEWYQAVVDGKAALWHGGTWHYASYKKRGLTDFFGKMQFALIPAGDASGRANTITNPLVYLVSDQKDDSVEEISAKLIAIATEPRINTLHAIKSAHLAVAKAQADIPLYANDRWASEATERLLGSANARPNHVEWGVYADAMWKGLEATWTGSKSAANAVADLEKELKAKLGNELIVK